MVNRTVTNGGYTRSNISGVSEGHMATHGLEEVTENAIRKVARECGGLSIECSDVAGYVQAVAARISTHLRTLDVLEEMLASYSGTVILISHDRDFLDRVVTSVVIPEGDGRWTEYPGGYADMLAQRGADVSRADANQKTQKPAKTSETAEAKPAAKSSSKQRMTFKDKHALETLPVEMEKLQSEKAKLQKRLDDPGLYARDRKAFTETSEALAAVETKLAAAEERWLELEMLREELES